MQTLSPPSETRDAAEPPEEAIQTLNDASRESTLPNGHRLPVRSLGPMLRNPRRNRGTPLTQIVVETHLRLKSSPPEWIEDELVRRGARHARLLENGAVSVTVCASSPETAQNLVRQLLRRISARAG
jgi:hypothetical protein